MVAELTLDTVSKLMGLERFDGKGELAAIGENYNRVDSELEDGVFWRIGMVDVLERNDMML